MRAISISLLLMLIAPPLWAQSKPETQCQPNELLVGIANTPWFEPIIADPREIQVQAQVYDLSRPFEYSLRKKNHKIWDITLGQNIPNLNLDHCDQYGNLPDDKLGVGRIGIQAGEFISFSMVESLSDASSPIFNTGYTFGFYGNVIKSLSETNQIGLLARLGHRSEHVGDEFVLNAQSRYGSGFKRIDINHEYLQVSGNWDHETSTYKFTQRLTLLSVIGGNGFYTLNVREHGSILPSVRNHEPAYALQITPIGSEGWRPILSFNWSLDTILDYTKTIQKKESSQFSESLVIGIRYLGSPFTPDFIIRIYYGLNPYGQFRKQNDYSQVALGFRKKF